jgi:hypothetical protein
MSLAAEKGQPGPAPTLSAAEFRRAFEELRRAHSSRTANQDCVQCQQCRRCTSCTFCHGSSDLVRCHYCVDSDHSVDCTHCRGCRDLIACSHCLSCQGCLRSAYLSHCLECTGCHYCFGCVGLTEREFHILNQAYDRSTYFKITAELSRLLGAGRR